MLNEKRNRTTASFDIDALRNELRIIKEKNLNEACFSDKHNLIAKLGVKVYPAEDRKTFRITCQQNLDGSDFERYNARAQKNNGDHECGNECGKVMNGGAGGIRTPYLLTASQMFSQLNYSPIMVNLAENDR